MLTTSQNGSPYTPKGSMGRLRSHSLDSGAPLVPPPLMSIDLICGTEEDDESFYTQLIDDDDRSASIDAAIRDKIRSRNSNYHRRRYDGNNEVRVRAQVMMRDDSTGGWVPMSGGGLSNVSVRKRKIHHEEYDQPCRHEYLIHGKRISDNSVDSGEVVLNCTIKRDFEYHKVMPTFHHWKTGNKKFGLTFQTAADARVFDQGVKAAVRDLLDANSLACPHKHYRDSKRRGFPDVSLLHHLQPEVGDDDVFMQLDLPVDKCCDTNSQYGSGSWRAPSPLGILDPTAPVDSTSNSPITIGAPTLMPTTSALMCTVSDPTHSHLHFAGRSRFFGDHALVSREKSRQLIADKVEVSGCHSVAAGLNHDKEYPYVKFPWREPPHEYSYPKLVDTLFDDGKSSRASFKKVNHAPVTKSNSGGSDGIKASAVTIGSGSSLCSNSIFDSSISGSGDGKTRSVACQLLPQGADNKSGSVSPPKQSLRPAGSSTTMTLTCAHCQEPFSLDSNHHGACAYAPADGLRRGIEMLTCLQCAKCLLYHCLSDAEGDYIHPCDCSNADGHWARRWFGLSLLSILVPCLCCYLPLMSCYKCGVACKVCGTRHEPS